MSASTATGRADSLVMGLVGLAHLLSHFYQIALGPLFPWAFGALAVAFTLASFANSKLVMHFGMRRLSLIALVQMMFHALDLFIRCSFFGKLLTDIDIDTDWEHIGI